MSTAWRPLRSSECRRERLVTLGWSEIIGRYNTPDWMVVYSTEKAGNEINTNLTSHCLTSSQLTSFRLNWVCIVIGRSHGKLGRFTAHYDQMAVAPTNRAACKSTPWVHFHTPNLTFIGADVEYRSPECSKCDQNYGFTAVFSPQRWTLLYFTLAKKSKHPVGKIDTWGRSWEKPPFQI